VIVGVIGFLIEAGILTSFASQPSIGVFYGRFISFPLAVSVTWALNRKITFNSNNPPWIESARYFVGQLIGALSNLALFYTLISAFKSLAQTPIVPLFFAAILGLAVNFTISKKWAFKKNG